MACDNSVTDDMASSESGDASSESEQEDFDIVYARIQREHADTDNNEDHEELDSEQDIEDDSPSPGIGVKEGGKGNTGFEFDNSTDVPIVKIEKPSGRIHFQTGTVINNDGTIHGDIQSHSKYNVEFHCCDKKKKISIIISVIIIAMVIILVIILQNFS